MADRPREGEPGYDWLYGARPDHGSDSDPEPTRVMPTMNRPSEQPPRPARAERPHRSSGAPPARPRPRKRRHPLRWVKWVLVAWLVFLLAVPVFAWTKMDKVDADPQGDRPGSQPGATYLLVGSDSRQGLSAEERRELGTGNASGQRTDTIMLLHTGSGPSLLLSIPRDSIVDVPGHGEEKINAAFAFGGPELLVKTIESETGIRVDGYVEIGFGGFVNVVDAVGGIEICPDEAMKDKDANLDIPKGCQEANGVKALGYARSRKTSALGDIDRARRQREVVSKVGKKAVSPWSVLNPVRYYRLNMAGAESVSVGRDTGPVDLTRFVWGMTQVSGQSGMTCTVPIVDLAVTWDRERATRLFNLIQEDRTEDVPDDLCLPSGLRNQ